MNKIDDITWDTLKLVIFDVDGTLYSQPKLRRKMFMAIIRYYILRPWKYKELLILYHFRKEREKKAGYHGDNLQEEQYVWCQQKSKSPLIRIKKVVDKWIFSFPNKYLKKCMYPGVELFFEDLERRGILTAIYSDYDAEKKLENMYLQADLIVSSTDAHINAFKPLPNGLNYITSKLGIKDKNNCLFLGDRKELDGECAKFAGIPFLFVNKKEAGVNFYKILSNQLNR
jgi:putative hydrolase of the HAD superfamily